MEGETMEEAMRTALEVNIKNLNKMGIDTTQPVGNLFSQIRSCEKNKKILEVVLMFPIKNLTATELFEFMGIGQGVNEK